MTEWKRDSKAQKRNKQPSGIETTITTNMVPIPNIITLKHITKPELLGRY